MVKTFTKVVEIPYKYFSLNVLGEGDGLGGRVPYKRFEAGVHERRRREQETAGRVRKIRSNENGLLNKFNTILQMYVNPPAISQKNMNFWIRLLIEDERRAWLVNNEKEFGKKPAIYFIARRRDYTQLKEIEYYDGFKALTVWHR